MNSRCDIYVADFETTTDAAACFVWACGIQNINTLEFYCDNNIEFFFDFFKNKKATVYFHNAKFDCEFIFFYLYNHNFKYVKSRKDLETNTFTTLISDKGVFYSCEICFRKNSKVKNILTIYDSLKLLPMSVDKIAQTFKLPITKLDLNYTLTRDKNHVLTEHEKEYLKHDTEIVCLALQELFKQQLTHMTTASNALNSYKELLGLDKYKKYFPEIPYEVDKDMRRAYKGGFTYLNPLYKNKIVNGGIILDVNSLYPSVMYECKLPYGEYIFYEGEYKYDRIYNLYIQHLACEFELKESGIPTIQIKNNIGFIPTEYLTDSHGEIINLYLTNIDLKLFFDNYNVKNLVYINGYKFKSSNKLFKNYIDYWIGIKNQATIDKNHGLRTIAKLMLNSLYGKFALNPNVQGKYPVLDNGIIKYELGEKEIRKANYLPIGIFVTSYARYKTITNAKKLGDNFIYADTDSLHIKGYNIPDTIEVDPVKLGAWKKEGEFSEGKYIRAKTYVEKIKMDRDEIDKFINANSNLKNLDYGDSLLNITCAGLPDKCYSQVTFENFKEGAVYSGKLVPLHVNGGVVLHELDFTIK